MWLNHSSHNLLILASLSDNGLDSRNSTECCDVTGWEWIMIDTAIYCLQRRVFLTVRFCRLSSDLKLENIGSRIDMQTHAGSSSTQPFSQTDKQKNRQNAPGASVYQRIISNNPHAHYEQWVNPRQVRGFNDVLYKLWPLLMPWLAASRYQPCWRESLSK